MIYLSSRITKVSSYLKEHLTAKQFVADVIQQYQQHVANTHKEMLSKIHSAA